jgi:hypothetical protein
LSRSYTARLPVLRISQRVQIALLLRFPSFLVEDVFWDRQLRVLLILYRLVRVENFHDLERVYMNVKWMRDF